MLDSKYLYWRKLNFDRFFYFLGFFVLFRVDFWFCYNFFFVLTPFVCLCFVGILCKFVLLLKILIEFEILFLRSKTIFIRSHRMIIQYISFVYRNYFSIILELSLSRIFRFFQSFSVENWKPTYHHEKPMEFLNKMLIIGLSFPQILLISVTVTVPYSIISQLANQT